jgi:hypothetical protein
MIICGLWFDNAFWFGTGRKTQKARNLAKNPNCIVGTQNAAEAVILEGVAELITDAAIRKKLEPTSLRKYGMSGSDGSEPVYRVRPSRVFGLIEKSFPKTATRWTFDSGLSVRGDLSSINHKRHDSQRETLRHGSPM